MKNLIRLGVVVFAVATTLGFSGVLWKLENMNAWMREVGNSGNFMHRHLSQQMAAQQNRIPPAVFESPPPSPFSEGIWENLTGPWDASKTMFTKAIAGFEGDLYVGLGTSERAALPLWRFDGKNWDHVPGPWGQNYRGVYSIHGHNGDLYVGTEGENAEVWRLADGRWSNISGNWVEYSSAYSMAEFDGALFLGLKAKDWRKNGHNGALFRFQGEVWEKIGGDGINGSWSGGGVI